MPANEHFNQVSLSNMSLVTQFIAQLAKKNQMIAFWGAMGTGKTTLIRLLCAELGTEQAASSPTFSLVNEYSTSTGQTIYHFDFYRIKQLEEVFDMGYEEYFYSGNLCLVEWPELIEPLLPVERTDVRLTLNADGTRDIHIIGVS